MTDTDYLTRLGAVALAGVVASGVVAFWGNTRATRVALDAEQRATATAYERANDAIESHNGKIRQWELDWAKALALLATKADVAPLVRDYERRVGGAITAGKFWGVIAVVGGGMLTTGIALAKLLPGVAG